MSAASQAAPASVYSLSNGLRIAAEDSGAETSTIALHVEAGTRNEKLNGVSNLISRLAGKGTGKYNQQQLETELARIGASLSIDVGREVTSFTVNSFSKDSTKVVDILSDIVKNAVYDENNLNIERQRILSELQQFNDLETIAMDYLYSVAFQGTPLAFSLTGSRDNIARISRNDILAFIDNNYKAPRMLLSAVGGVRQDTLAEAAEKFLSDVTFIYPGEVELVQPCRFTASQVEHRDDAMQVAHVAAGLEGCALSDPAAIPLAIFTRIVGAGDKTSGGYEYRRKEFQRAVYEEPGLYAYRAFNHQYSDQGLFGIYLAAVAGPPLDDSTEYINKLWAYLCGSVVDSQVEMGKNELRTELLSANQLSRSNTLAQQIFFQGGRKSVEEVVDEINSVNTKQLQKVLYDYIYDQGFARSAYGPTEALFDYNMAQSHLYWLRM